MTPCGAPSAQPPSGGHPLLCDREAGHPGEHSALVAEEDGHRRYRWGKAERRKQTVQITLTPEAVARVDTIAARTGQSRSGTVESLIRDAALPRP